MRPPPDSMFFSPSPGKWSVSCNLTISVGSSDGRGEMTSVNNQKSLTFVFGDLWFCAGQSNMNWPLSKLANGKQVMKKGVVL